MNTIIYGKYCCVNFKVLCDLLYDIQPDNSLQIASNL